MRPPLPGLSADADMGPKRTILLVCEHRLEGSRTDSYQMEMVGGRQLTEGEAYEVVIILLLELKKKLRLRYII